jgi:hypothetical protein
MSKDFDKDYYGCAIAQGTGAMDFVPKLFWTLEDAEKYAKENIPSIHYVDFFKMQHVKARP